MRILIAVVLFASLGCSRSHHYTVTEIEQAVRSGKVDKKIAGHLSKVSSLSVRELATPGLPIQVFAFESDAYTHTLLVDGTDLIDLCGSTKRGEVARDFKLERDGSRWVLTFALGPPEADGVVDRGRHIFNHPPKR